MFIPGFASIAGDVICKIIDEAGVHWAASSYFSFWIWHAGRVAGIHR
jgi:hypothetical protein